MPTPTGSCTSPSASTNSRPPTGASRSGSAATSPASTPPASSDPQPPGTGNTPRRPASSCSSLRAEPLYTLDGAHRRPRRSLTSNRGPRRRLSARPISELDRQLLAIPAATYIPALTGRHPNRASKIPCPFHEDRTPSLQLYEHDWYCYGACRTGGSIYDLGALLYGLGTRGRDFLKLRQRLADDLRLAGPRAPGRPAPAKGGMIAAASVRCCRSR